MQKSVSLFFLFLKFLASFSFVVSHLKNTPSCSLKSSDVIVVKKKKFIKTLPAFTIFMF